MVTLGERLDQIEEKIDAILEILRADIVFEFDETALLDDYEIN
jgi:hypothetical protein